VSEQLNIMVTGAAGFIGSSLVTELNSHGYFDLILVDNFSKPGKERYLSNKLYLQRVEVSALLKYLNEDDPDIHFVFHLGGMTANKDDFRTQNVIFARQLALWCFSKNIPFVYASSSSTYGAGGYGYSDDEKLISYLIPLNDYGRSKQEFDLWMLNQGSLNTWAGLKLFNVFGPNEYHKGKSASVAFKSFFEIRETGSVTLFGASRPQYRDGDQLRDFIYVKDVVDIFYWFFERLLKSGPDFPSGIFNVGTGIGRSFNDVAKAVFKSMNLPAQIEYRDIPDEVLKSYPENVVADINKLREAGYQRIMWSLDDAIDDMVKNYLIKGEVF